MKNKYFLIILASVFSSILMSLVFTFYYVEKEVERSLDTQLETMASTILASGLSVDMMDNIDDVEEVLSEVFEEERVDRFIRIYDASNLKLLYANEFGQLVSLPPPHGKKLSTYEYGNKKFRILEVRNGALILQLALIRDSFLSRIKVLEKNILVFSAGLLAIILLITALSLKALLKPLKELGNDLAQWSDRLTLDFDPMRSATQQLLTKTQGRMHEWHGEEIHEFIKQLQKFAQKLSHYLEFSQKQYSVLAHELKTPLTIIRNDLDQIKASGHPQVEKVISEVDALSKLIRSFLSWSQQAANSSVPEELYALKLSEIVEPEVLKLQSLYPNRIQLQKNAETALFCRRDHAGQLVKNMIENALTHGPAHSSVTVTLENQKLIVSDSGTGLPLEVMKNLGAPFNRHGSSSGHGLGLAWIKTICDLYDWNLKFETHGSQHHVVVTFPS